MADLLFLRRTGLAQSIMDMAGRGTPVIGICGGYQMLGKEINDPQHVEDGVDWMAGLGLLPISTWFEPTKTTRQVRGRVIQDCGLFDGCLGVPVTGYEIHMGTTVVDGAQQVLEVGSLEGATHLDGAVDGKGLIFGTYLHGIFDSAEFRRALLTQLGRRKGQALQFGEPLASREQQYDKLADLVRSNIDVGFLRSICSF